MADNKTISLLDSVTTIKNLETLVEKLKSGEIKAVVFGYEDSDKVQFHKNGDPFMCCTIAALLGTQVNQALAKLGGFAETDDDGNL